MTSISQLKEKYNKDTNTNTFPISSISNINEEYGYDILSTIPVHNNLPTQPEQPQIDYESIIMPLLPKSLAIALQGARDHSNAPFSILLPIALGTINTATHIHFDTQKVWGTEFDTIATSLWFVAIAAPASAKSTVMDFFNKPIKKYEENDLAYYQKFSELTNTLSEKKYKTALAKFLEDQNNPIPVQPKYLREAFEVQVSSTVSKFCEDLNKTTHGSFITAEGGSMFSGHTFQDETRGVEAITMLSSLWDGAEIHKKKNDLTVNIKNRRLSMCICLQPSTAKLIFAKPMFEEQGFIGRILVTEVPHFNKLPMKLKDKKYRTQQEAHLKKVAAFNNTVDKLFSLKLKTRIDYPCELNPDVIKLSEDAIQYISDIFDDYLLNEASNREDAGAAASRACEQIMRLSATIAAYRFADTTDEQELENERQNILISEEDIQAAHVIFEMFLDNKKNMSMPIIETFDNKNSIVVEAILTYMKKKNITQISMRELVRNVWKFKNLDTDFREKVIREGIRLEVWSFDDKQISLFEELQHD